MNNSKVNIALRVAVVILLIGGIGAALWYAGSYRRELQIRLSSAAQSQLDAENLQAAELLAVSLLSRFPDDTQGAEILSEVRRRREEARQQEARLSEERHVEQLERIDALERSMNRSFARLSRALADLAAALPDTADTQPESDQALLLDYDEAEVQSLVTRGRELYEQQRYLEAQAELQRALLMDQERAGAQAYLAASIFEQNPADPETRPQALRLARAALENETTAPFAYYTLGRIYEQEGLPDQAEDAYQSAIERRPDYLAAHQALGTLLLRQGRGEEAERHLARVTDNRPEDPAARFQLLQVAVAEGAWEEALGHGRAVADAGRGGAAAYAYMAEAYRGLGDCDTAVEYWGQAYDVRPGWEYRRSMAECYAQAGSPQQAVQEYLRGARENPRNSDESKQAAFEMITHAASLYEQAGRVEDAIDVYEEGRRLLPEEHRIDFALATLYEEAGRYTPAIEGYEKLLSTDSTLPGAHLGLARSYLALGETARARAVLRRLRQERPDSAEVDQVRALVDEGR